MEFEPVEERLYNDGSVEGSRREKNRQRTDDSCQASLLQDPQHLCDIQASVAESSTDQYQGVVPARFQWSQCASMSPLRYNLTQQLRTQLLTYLSHSHNARQAYEVEKNKLHLIYSSLRGSNVHGIYMPRNVVEYSALYLARDKLPTSDAFSLASERQLVKYKQLANFYRSLAYALEIEVLFNSEYARVSPRNGESDAL